MADDEWTTVKTKRTACKGQTQRQIASIHFPKRIVNLDFSTDYIEDDIRPTDIAADCKKISQSLRESSFFKGMTAEVINANLRDNVSMVSLGIGQFTSSQSALLQLAMVLCIKEQSTKIKLNNAEISNEDRNTCTLGRSDQRDFECKIFDPLFSAKECEICLLLGFLVSEENRKGKHRAENGPTIFFMPHCPYRLYVNLLWENWDNLGEIIILGNSFLSYSIRRPAEGDKTDCMRLLRPLVTEVPVWDLFTKTQPKRYEQSLPAELSFLENAFCDLSLHYFRRESLDSPLGQQIIKLRPLEEDIDQAALQDIELFG